jgi:transportin-1
MTAVVLTAGCIDGLEQHLPQLVPWLLGTLTNPKVRYSPFDHQSANSKALVRSITCWTLGRYSSWCVKALPEDHTKFLLPTMEGVS